MGVLGDLTEEEKAKLGQARQDSGSAEVSTEMMMLAEFGIHFGFDGIRAIVNNEITDLSMVNELILAARKLKGYK